MEDRHSWWKCQCGSIDTASRAVAPNQLPRTMPAALPTVPLLDVIHRLYCGVVVTVPENRPIFMNRFAERILEHRDGLTVTPRGLEASRPDEARALREAIRQAANGELGMGATIIVTRRAAPRPLAIHIPLNRHSTDFAREATVFISHPSLPAVLIPDTLCRLYGLTRAEAALAIELAQGQTLEQAAERSCTSIHTVRTHLKRMLLKTDTNRQTDLVRLILMSSAGVNTA